MLWYVCGAAGAAVILFLAVLVIRAAAFVPKPELTPSDREISLDEEKIIKDMQEMIRCRTVSYNDETLMDKFFEEGHLTEDEMRAGIRKGLVDRSIYPVFCEISGG